MAVQYCSVLCCAVLCWAVLPYAVLHGGALQVHRYGDLPRSVAELASMCAKANRAQDITPDGKFQWRGDKPIVAFGKHGGECYTPVLQEGGCIAITCATSVWFRRGGLTLLTVSTSNQGSILVQGATSGGRTNPSWHSGGVLLAGAVAARKLGSRLHRFW